jgi:RNA polymerase sigma factor (sigma-70 family)
VKFKQRILWWKYIGECIQDALGGGGSKNVCRETESSDNSPLLSAEQEVKLAKAIEAGELAGEWLEKLRKCDNASDQSQAEADFLQKFGGNNLALKQLVGEFEELIKYGKLARDHFIKSNLGLVYKIASGFYKHYNGKFEFEDLLQEGMCGLIHAVDMFDYAKGFKFSVYAARWIKSAIGRFIYKLHEIHVPEGVSVKLNQLPPTYLRLEKELGRKPSIEELATELGMGVNMLRSAMNATGVVSLDTVVTDDIDDKTLAALIADDGAVSPMDEAIAGDAKLAVDSALAKVLDDREARIICMYYGIGCDPKSLEAIGDNIGYSRETVRGIKKIAMEKLRNSPAFAGLRDLLFN